MKEHSEAAGRGDRPLGHPRFELLRPLGRGGAAEVWLARDVTDGEVVALKRLRAVSLDERVAFKREFSVLSVIRHPSLVRVHELFVEGDDVWISMEHLDGEPLATHLHAHPERAMDVIAQLAEALAFLHGHELVHRDVTAANVLVRADGRAVLLDLGSVARTGAWQGPEDRTPAGALRTMAPEAAFGSAPSPAADVHALGVLLYECLEGVPPWDADPGRALIAKTRERAPRPAVGPWCPEALADWIEAALHADPGQRPSLATLRATTRAPPAPGVGPRRLFGRDDAVAALHTALAGLSEGEPRVVSVRARSGGGKSFFCERALGALHATGAFRVLVSTCTPHAQVPFAGIDAWVDLLRHAELAVLPEHAAELVALFPVLREAAPFRCVPPAAPSRDGLRRRAFDALAEILLALAAQRPTVLLLDDAHWLDEDSARFLTTLIEVLGKRRARAERTPLGLVLACRPVEHPPLDAVLASAARADLSLAALTLDPLPARAAEELVSSLLPPHLAHLAAGAAREAAGHPLLLVESARHLAEGGGIAEQTPSLADLVARRLSRVSDDAQRLFDVLCAASAPLSASTAAGAARVDRATAALRALSDERLVWQGILDAERVFAPAHDRLREARTGQWGERGRGIHRALAERLEHGRDGERDLAAWHFREAGDLPRAARAAVAAAERALGVQAHDRAAELYALALACEERVAWHRARAEALSASGRAEAAACAYERGAELATDAEAFELLTLAAERRMRGGDLARGVAIMDRALARAGLRRPRWPRLALAAGLPRELLVHLLEGRPRSGEARRRAPDAATRRRLDATTAAATGLTWADSFSASHFAGVHAWLALTRGEPRDVGRALALRCATNAAIGSPARAQLSDRIATVARALTARGDPRDVPFALVCIASAAHFTGEWARCDAVLDEVAAILRTGLPARDASWNDLHMVRAVNAGYRGDLARLDEVVTCAGEHAEDRGDLLLARVSNLGPAAAVTIARGHAERVIDVGRSTLAAYTIYPWGMIHTFAGIGISLAQLYLGRAEEAAATAAQNFSRGRRDLGHMVASHRITATYVDGIAALGLAWTERSARREAIARTERRARALAREPFRWAHACGLLLDAGVRGVRRGRGDPDVLARVEGAARAADMGVVAEVLARHRDALGGAPSSGPEWMEDPSRLAWALAPVVPPP